MSLKINFALIVMSFMLCRCQPRTTIESSSTLISIHEVHNIINDSIKSNQYVVIDLRQRMDFIQGHLISSYWVTQDSLPDKLPLLLTEKRPLIFYDSGNVSHAIKSWLAKNNVANVLFMEGGFNAWLQNGYPAAIQLVRNTDPHATFPRREISSTDAYESTTKDSAIVLIDIRPAVQYATSHISGALSIPFVPINEFVVQIESYNFPRNIPIILYSDDEDILNDNAYEVMMRNDFTNVFLLRGGLSGWKSKPYPMNP